MPVFQVKENKKGKPIIKTYQKKMESFIFTIFHFKCELSKFAQNKMDNIKNKLPVYHWEKRQSFVFAIFHLKCESVKGAQNRKDTIKNKCLVYQIKR
jgi:NRPS condensation-like uncharacterized protein